MSSNIDAVSLADSSVGEVTWICTWIPRPGQKRSRDEGHSVHSGELRNKFRKCNFGMIRYHNGTNSTLCRRVDDNSDDDSDSDEPFVVTLPTGFSASCRVMRSSGGAARVPCARVR